jgi:ATP-dependent DNA helicase RecQ
LANQYRIAVGSGFMVSYDFDMSSFTSTYGLEILTTYNALKVLQEEGFLELNEGFYSPSTIHFLVDQSKLYEFQIANAKLDPLIKMLMRTYGGELFVEYLKIQESKVAKNAKMEESDLIKQLEYLDQVGILAYNPRKDKPQITFLTARFDAGKLPLNTKRIEERRQNAISKAKSMVGYIKNTSLCRANQISSYFGEESDDFCGICDVCLENRKHHDTEAERISKKIIQTLSSGNLFSLHNLHEIPGLKNDDFTVRILRELEEEGLIMSESNGTYKIKS